MIPEFNAANRKSIREAEKRAARIERERGFVVVSLMSSVSGREWVWARLTDSHIFSSTYDDNLQRMAFLEGQRSAGLSLLADITRWCPEEFILAMREANARSSSSAPDTRPDAEAGTAGERSLSEDSGWDDQGSSGEANGHDRPEA